MQGRRALVILFAAAVAGCVAAPPGVTAARPFWMEAPQRKYPINLYMTAVGEGDTVQAAESVALGNLAKIFRSEIVVDEVLQERYHELIGERNRYQEQTQFDRHVAVRSALSLQNVQYPERYTDSRTGRVYVLAALHRAETAGIYVARLKENHARTGRFVERSRSDSPAMRYAALSAAVAISADSRLMLEQLDVLLPAAKRDVLPAYEHDQLEQWLADAAKAIGFRVEIANDDQGKLSQSVAALLTGLGFVVDPEHAFLRVSGSVAMEDTDLGRDGLHFVRYQFHLDVVDAQGRTVAALSERGREGHVSRTEAVNRCVRTLGSAIERQLSRRVMAFFDGMVAQ